MDDISVSRHLAEDGSPAFAVHQSDGTTYVSGYVPIAKEDARYWLEEAGIIEGDQDKIVVAMDMLGIFG